MKKSSLIFLIASIILSFFGCIKENKTTEIKTERKVEIKEKPIKINNTNPAEFEIANIQDQSRKAMGTKSLSQFSKSELKELPTNRKVLYKLIISNQLKANQIESTVEKIISEITSNDYDIDEIILWLYSDKDMINKTYDIGTAIWAPYGDLGNVDAEIANNNDRGTYEINYQIIDNLDEYLSNRSKSENKFGLSESKRRQLYREVVKGEDEANDYGQIEKKKIKKTRISTEQLKIEFSQIENEVQDRMNNHRIDICKKYAISNQQLDLIIDEAFEENWLLD